MQKKGTRSIAHSRCPLFPRLLFVSLVSVVLSGNVYHLSERLTLKLMLLHAVVEAREMGRFWGYRRPRLSCVLYRAGGFSPPKTRACCMCYSSRRPSRYARGGLFFPPVGHEELSLLAAVFTRFYYMLKTAPHDKTR